MIEPELGFKIIIYGGWVLAALGLFKVLVWLIGELCPRCYAKIKSEAVRSFMTGKGNRLLFGLGGLLTLVLGLAFVVIGVVLFRFASLVAVA